MDALLDPKDLAALARLAVQTVYNRRPFFARRERRSA